MFQNSILIFEPKYSQTWLNDHQWTTATCWQRPVWVINDQSKSKFYQTPLSNGRFFLVPRVAVVHRFDCTDNVILRNSRCDSVPYKMFVFLFWKFDINDIVKKQNWILYRDKKNVSLIQNTVASVQDVSQMVRNNIKNWLGWHSLCCYE